MYDPLDQPRKRLAPKNLKTRSAGFLMKPYDPLEPPPKPRQQKAVLVGQDVVLKAVLRGMEE